MSSADVHETATRSAAIAAVAIAVAVIQPSQSIAPRTRYAPITRLSRASISNATKIGITMIPLITALKNKARIGGIGVKWSPTPMSVDKAMIV